MVISYLRLSDLVYEKYNDNEENGQEHEEEAQYCEVFTLPAGNLLVCLLALHVLAGSVPLLLKLYVRIKGLTQSAYIFRGEVCEWIRHVDRPDVGRDHLE